MKSIAEHADCAGFTVEDFFNLTKFDRWFSMQTVEIVDFEVESVSVTN